MNKTCDDARPRSLIRPVSVLLLGTFLLQGCYSVHAIEAGGPQPGSRVVAQLTPDGSQQMASQVGPRVTAVEGVLDQATAGDLSLRLVRTEGSNQVSTYWNQEEVTIPRPAISALRERRLDKPRSFALAAAIVGGALLAATLSHSIFANDDPVNPNPSPQN
jgi:hypothetical protein